MKDDNDDDALFTFESMMANWHSFLQTGDDCIDDGSDDNCLDYDNNDDDGGGSSDDSDGSDDNSGDDNDSSDNNDCSDNDSDDDNEGSDNDDDDDDSFCYYHDNRFTSFISTIIISTITFTIIIIIIMHRNNIQATVTWYCRLHESRIHSNRMCVESIRCVCSRYGNIGAVECRLVIECDCGCDTDNDDNDDNDDNNDNNDDDDDDE